MSPKTKLAPPPAPDEAAFAEVVGLIAAARQQAYQAVNTALIDLYWQVGEYISRKIEAAEWGTGVVPKLAQYIARTQPGQRGFTRSNLLRMRQFYETYRDEPIVAPLVRQLPWTHNLIILGQSKRPEEREFYLRMAVKERWAKRELERQFRVALFERTVLSPAKVAAALRQMHPEAGSIFKDAYRLPRDSADRTSTTAQEVEPISPGRIIRMMERMSQEDLIACCNCSAGLVHRGIAMRGNPNTSPLFSAHIA